jgi:hypothetical protein
MDQGVPVVAEGAEEILPLVESIKDQHLLKPPTVMENSKLSIP